MGKQETEQMVDYFDMLPEGCVADIVSQTTPVDACHVAVLNTSFYRVSDSDPVWERFLPVDYGQLVSRAVDHRVLPPSPSNKDLYLFLSDHPLIIDNGALSFSLDKKTGKKCFMMAAEGLTIVWGDTPRYWRWLSDPESRFGKVVELINVCWFEIHGRISTSLLSGDTAYTAYLVYQPTTTLQGFEGLPLEISVGIIGEESIKRDVFVDPEGVVHRQSACRPRRMGVFHIYGASHPRPQVVSPVNADRQRPSTRKDGWLEIELAQYFNKEGEDRELEISLLEVKGGNWKSGLIIQGLELRPTGGKRL